MKRKGILRGAMHLVGFIGMTLAISGVALAQTRAGQETTTEVGATEWRTGTWRGGGGIGFLAETPDDTAFAVNLNADRFLNENFSLGPLLQLGFTDDLALYGLSGQGKYWWDIGAGGRTKMFAQGGVGFVHAAFQRDDTSWLVPLGVGIEHTLNAGPSLYGVFLLNLTNLDTGRGTEADIMPGVNFGVQF